MKTYQSLREQFQLNKGKFRVETYKQIQADIEELLENEELYTSDKVNLEDLLLDVEVELEIEQPEYNLEIAKESVTNPTKQINITPQTTKQDLENNFKALMSDLELIIGDMNENSNLSNRVNALLIDYTLEYTKQNRSQTARILGISVKTVRNHISQRRTH